MWKKLFRKKFKKGKPKSRELLPKEEENKRGVVIGKRGIQDFTTQELDYKNTIKLTVVGLPNGITTKDRRAILEKILQIAVKRVSKVDFDKGQRLDYGKGKINFLDTFYEIEFTLDALRKISAMEIYKQAFDIVNEGSRTGAYDEELAQTAADFFRDEAWKEVSSSKIRKEDESKVGARSNLLDKSKEEDSNKKEEEEEEGKDE